LLGGYFSEPYLLLELLQLREPFLQTLPADLDCRPAKPDLPFHRDTPCHAWNVQPHGDGNY